MIISRSPSRSGPRRWARPWRDDTRRGKPPSQSTAQVRRRLLTVAVLSGLLFAPVTTAFAATDSPQAPQAPQATAKPTVKVTVIGDSYTSGEGANPATYKLVPVPGQTTSSGQPVYGVDPAHQSTTAPTLQALNQIQAANPDATISVTFVPVSGATRASLHQTTQPGTPFEQPPQINAVKDADVVLVGIGGNDARFTDWIKTVLSSTGSTSTQAFPQFMAQFNDGTYLANQVALLNDVSNLASPSATIVSLGYPKAMPAAVPGTPTWWSPFSWSTISQDEANMSNQLAGALNTANEQASTIASGQHAGQQFLYADVSNALQGHELFTDQEGLNGLTPSNLQGSYHPNDLGQQLLGSVLMPYVEQAVNSQLAQQGVKGAEDVAPITPGFNYQWNLRVQLPLQLQSQPKAPDQTPSTGQQPAQDQQPAKDQPAQDQPAQDQPSQDQPSQDQPAKDQPAQDQPADKSTPDGTAPDATQPDGPHSDANPADGTPQPAADNTAPAPDATPADGTTDPNADTATAPAPADGATPAADPSATDPATDATAPAADPAATGPAADGTAPAADSTATDPAADPAPADPAAEPAPADPAADPTATDPAAQPAPTDPAADPAPVDPAAQPAPADPAADPTATDPTAEPAPADLAADPAPADPAAEPAPAPPAPVADPAPAPDPAPVVVPAPDPVVVAPLPPPIDIPAPPVVIPIPDPVVTPVAPIEVPEVPPVESDPDPGINPIGDTGVIDDGVGTDTGIDTGIGDTGIGDAGFGDGGGDGGGD